jgi:hypothetical protein
MPILTVNTSGKTTHTQTVHYLVKSHDNTKNPCKCRYTDTCRLTKKKIGKEINKKNCTIFKKYTYA